MRLESVEALIPNIAAALEKLFCRATATRSGRSVRNSCMIMPVFGLEFFVSALYLFFEDGKKHTEESKNRKAALRPSVTVSGARPGGPEQSLPAAPSDGSGLPESGPHGEASPRTNATLHIADDAAQTVRQPSRGV